jgi:hypothetical protein
MRNTGELTRENIYIIFTEMSIVEYYTVLNRAYKL